MPALFSLMVGTVEQVSNRDKYILTLNVFFFVCLLKTFLGKITHSLYLDYITIINLP